MTNHLTTGQVPDSGGTGDLERLLVAGLASKQLTEEEFWASVKVETDALLTEAGTRPSS